MNKTAFIKRVAQQNKKEQITQRLYNQVLKELLTGIQSELAAGRTVQFQGFGTFYSRIHKGGKDATLKQTNQLSTKQYASPRFDLDHCSRKQSERRNNLNFRYYPLNLNLSVASTQ
jgi:nucleoid DNA-binding protein